ncbi:hypothetical protein JTE90_006024 [Oedothorax gibbosus]|uniref:Retrotransposon gag domain-containing protein n=1 Tax=Oedothorax gibbosus TaxID=931172 RepID=A0AAV6TQU9_9ARAC|nr:hypothetical protein JTE90_006024 [Oedothorax gibbosus]
MITLLPSRIYALLKDIVSPDKPKDKTFDELVLALKKQLNPPPSTIAERFRFHRRHQREGETINTFCAELKKLARYCDFKDNLTDSLRDIFVCGLNNDTIQKRLLEEEKLALDKALSIATAMETASKDTAELQGKSTGISGVNKLYIQKSTAKGNSKKEANSGNALPLRESDSTSTKLRDRDESPNPPLTTTAGSFDLSQSTHSKPPMESPDPSSVVPTPVPVPEPTLRRSTRVRRPPDRFTCS